MTADMPLHIRALAGIEPNPHFALAREVSTRTPLSPFELLPQMFISCLAYTTISTQELAPTFGKLTPRQDHEQRSVVS
ncbi:hypothetical protein VTI28DRAFT_2423 [Corynascus sepedonium]